MRGGQKQSDGYSINQKEVFTAKDAKDAKENQAKKTLRWEKAMPADSGSWDCSLAPSLAFESFAYLASLAVISFGFEA